MSYNKNFAKIYNHIFYSNDKTEKVVEKLSGWSGGWNKNTKILDVGCGTGVHLSCIKKTLGLENVFGLDTSKEMLEECPKNIQLFCGDLKEYEEENFDVIYSIFHVVNHITTEKELASFFFEVSKRLKKNGIFIFDAYNGYVVLKSALRETKTTKDEFTVFLSPNLQERNLELNYTILVKNEYSFFQRINAFMWFVEDFKKYLNENEFDILKTINYSNFQEETEDNCFKLYFVCRKR